LVNFVNLNAMYNSYMNIDELRALLDYDQTTGLFYWRVKRKKMEPGDSAGAINSKGYRYISINNVMHRANRLAWMHFHGAEPSGQIDHIDGDKLNDRIANLRDVSQSTNLQNRNLPNRRKTGRSSAYLGVSWDRGTNKWRAKATVNGRSVYLGQFDAEIDAHNAYLAAKQRLTLARA
jgi:hypothetical protein